MPKMRWCFTRFRHAARTARGGPKCVGASLGSGMPARQNRRTGASGGGGPKCVGTLLILRRPRLSSSGGKGLGGTEFRNCAPGRWGLGLQLLGRMGEWSWLAAAGPAWVGGVPGPAGLSRPVYGAAWGPSALPSAITLTFASRSGSSSGALVLGCSLGSLAFEPCPSSAFVRRGPPGGKTYAYPEGHPHW